MDWTAALCLSVPIAVGVALAGYALGSVADAMVVVADRLGRALDRLSRRLADPKNDEAPTLAQAHVRAAKYQARAITVKPKAHEPKAPTIFERWMAREGRGLPQTVVDQVEWACDRLLAGEAGDAEQGDEDAARIVLRQFARGVEESIDDQMRRGATGA